ncbi:GNAT family N-acetyltransferase [Conchiformibius kuhniae]|uniref:GNAT family N-acetyltransferase n=1 Tax=Conchiformibius kuhniae TaxID=211502 RepID=A0A8T9MXQ9_9NEIS|nr:GNAT family protein [Conchiformibius kuhniae]UOP04663.1 GNAT family N-acetyltransferase [Conchiformibius kuhniae]
MFEPTTVLHGFRVRLEPLAATHEAGLRTAAADGELWHLVYASVPEPPDTAAYIAQAHGMPDSLPFAVIDETDGSVLGSTRFYHINRSARRAEIGYTWYAARCQQTHVNTVCKYLMLSYAFETADCLTVGWRTDGINIRSQAAIERLGAKKDGVLRGFQVRRDGSVRDTVMYSMTASEWADGAKARLAAKLPFQAA